MRGSDFIERIKREVSLESYISRHVKLKRTGGRSLGLCPFHNEKSPSFTVSHDLQVFHCFGCGKSGDLITFVREYEKADFRKALEILSEYSGIPLELGEKAEKESNRKVLYYKLNELYAGYFHRNLLSEDGYEARKYLEDRGVGIREIEKFGLGYALPGFENSSRTVLRTDEDRTVALELGLVKSKDSRKSNVYDFFRDRIIFPIRDGSGKVSGFGGRVIRPSEEGKYINSQASLVYDKSRMFYGLYQAQDSIRRIRTAILVEGYLDVIGLHNKEFTHTVAPLGTAFTVFQLKLVKNIADELILLFDGDSAGRKAAVKAAEICIREGMPGRVVLLENGVDPFDLSRTKNTGEIGEILSKSTGHLDFFLSELLLYAVRESGTELKKKAVDNLFPFLKSLEKETDRELILTEASKKIGISSETLWNDFKKGNPVSFAPEKVDIKTEKKAVSSVQSDLERRFIAKLLKRPEFWEYAEEMQNLRLYDNESAFIWEVMISRYSSGDDTGVNLLLDMPEAIQNIFTGILVDEESLDLEEERKVFRGIIERQKLFMIEKELDEISGSGSGISEMDRMIRLHSLSGEKQRILEEIRKVES